MRLIFTIAAVFVMAQSAVSQACPYSEFPLTPEQVQESDLADRQEQASAEIVSAVILVKDDQRYSGGYVVPAKDWIETSGSAPPYDFGVTTVRYGHSSQQGGGTCEPYRYWRANPFDPQILRRGLLLPNGFRASEAIGYFAERPNRNSKGSTRYFIVISVAACSAAPRANGACG